MEGCGQVFQRKTCLSNHVEAHANPNSRALHCYRKNFDEKNKGGVVKK